MMNNNNRSVSSALNDNASSGGNDVVGNCMSTSTLKKGPWTAAEDAILMEYVKKHGEGNWNAVQKNSGLSRCGKSCRLRWANHLRPNLKKGSFSPDEERLILELHSKLGNKWARMAAQLPGRTDNEIKNYWNTRVKRRQRAGLPLYPNDIQKQTMSFPHHHHQQQPSVLSQSLLRTPTQFSSSQHHKSNFGSSSSSSLSSSLHLFDPLNLSAQTHFSNHQTNNNNNMTHFLPTSSTMNGYKRFRGQNFGFSHQFSPPPPSHHHQTLPHNSSSLFNHNLSSQLLPPSFQLGNYDLNPPPSLLQHHHHYESNNHILSPMGSSFSIKLELPSNQMPQPAANTAASGTSTDDMDYKINTSLNRSNSGLLDALLQESQAMGSGGGGGDSRSRQSLVSEQQQQDDEQEKCRIDGLVRDAPPPVTTTTTTPLPLGSSSNQWDDSSPANSSIGLGIDDHARVKKKEPTDEINSMEDDDLSSLLDSIPSTMLVSDFYNDGGEISNGGQSSGVTDEDIGGLDMQHLPSTTTTTTNNNNNTNTTTMEHDWNIGAWSNEPQMC